MKLTYDVDLTLDIVKDQKEHTREGTRGSGSEQTQIVTNSIQPLPLKRSATK